MTTQALLQSRNKDFMNNIPDSFEEFLRDFESWLGSQKREFKHFLGLDYEIKIVIAESSHFTFSPSDKKITIPLDYLESFHKKLKQNDIIEEKGQIAYSYEDLKFSIFHELSHFRDIIFEKKDKRAMVNILKEVNAEKVKFGNDRVIPIGSTMHSVCNCLDDIIVNTEVEMDVGAKTSKEHLQGFYKYNLFADIIDKEGGSYQTSSHGIDFVGEGNGDCEINVSDTVDYSKRGVSQAFPYFFLRSFMVTDQKIILPENVENIIFASENRKSRRSVFKSIEKMVVNMESYFHETCKNPEFSARCESLKLEYIALIQKLRNILENKSEIEELLKKAIFTTGTHTKFTKNTIDLITLVKLFTLSTGKQKETHSLDICQSERYELYRSIFLPLQKGFVLMDLLKQDIKEDNKKSGKGEGEGEGKESSQSSGSGESHHSPDIDEKIRILEELEKQDNDKKAQELIKKEVEASKYDVTKVLESSGVSRTSIDITRGIIAKYGKDIEELVRFFIEQLYKIEVVENMTEFATKKGKLNVGNLISYISQDPSLGDIGKQKFYDKKEINEVISKKFKKIDLTLAIDISGSCDQFKGKDGMMNIIPTVLFIAMKHLEGHLRQLLDDQSFTIPVHYILYGDGAPFSSIESGMKSGSSEVLIAELNQNIIGISGGTNDTTAWQKISSKFDEVLSKDSEYVQELKENKRKPIVLQIADSDVSENGVEYLQNVFLKHSGNQAFVDSLPIKRVILGQEITTHLSEKEYFDSLKNGEGGNWDPVFLPDGRVQLKQIGVKRKQDILDQIKALFENFFSDINY